MTELQPRNYRIPIYQCRLIRDSSQPAETKRVNAPKVAAEVVAAYLADYDREAFVVLMLSIKNDIIGIHTVVLGSLSSASLRMADVFKAPIISNAAAVIVAHNHPSGDPAPSPEDVRVTGEIFKAGKTLDLEVLDHIIVGDSGRFVSLKERGLM